MKTTSGATAVQVVHSSRRGSRDIEHLGSAHDDAELELLKAAARQRLAAGQGEFDLGLEVTEPGPAGCWRRAAADHRDADGLPAGRPGARLPGAGFAGATGGDEVFARLVLARIIEPVDDHVERFWYRLKPFAADPEAEIARCRVLTRQEHHFGICVDPQSMT